ncbi:MAG TPA: hypothetical protein V6D47_13350 [Oscillatoriaceae cyanobacterium]
MSALPTKPEIPTLLQQLKDHWKTPPDAPQPDHLGQRLDFYA